MTMATHAQRLVTPLLIALVCGLVLPSLAAAQIVEYYHVDAIGSVRAVTDSSGTVVERHDYLPFGEEWNEIGGQTRRFTAKERDSETGLDYFGARYYASTRGRFTTIDPVQTWGENLVDPQRWNRYAYVRNNPLRYVDPDGRAIDTIADIGFIAYDVFDIGRSIFRGQGVSRTQVLALGGDVVGAVIPFASGFGAAIRAGAKAEHVVAGAARGAKAGSELVLDTNVVISHGKDFVKSGHNVVKSAVTDTELAGLVRRGKINMPSAASQIPSVGLPSVNTRINVRGGLTPGTRGNFADGIIGATAIERGSTLVTRDGKLAEAVQKAGGKVMEP
jgi:RHS repeat-associated protein